MMAGVVLDSLEQIFESAKEEHKASKDADYEDDARKLVSAYHKEGLFKCKPGRRHKGLCVLFSY
jgi:hypothetical protein